MRLDCGWPDKFPDWNNTDVDLGGWLVHEISTMMFLHMPVGFEAYLQKQQQDIERLELTPRWPGFVLSRSAMFRGSILYPLADEHSPARHVHRLYRPFHLRVHLFEGDVGQLRDNVRHMQSALLDEGRIPRELYLAYLTCPVCRDRRGGNKIMLLRRWEDSPKLKKRIRR